MFGALAFIFTTFTVGYLLLSLVFNENAPLRVPLKLALSFPVGFGVLSLLLYSWLQVWGHADQAYILMEFALLMIIGFVCIIRGNHLSTPKSLYQRRPHLSDTLMPPYLFLSALLLIIFLMSGLCLVKQSLLMPSGGWDAWAMWNMKARFIIKSGMDWRSVLTQDMDWSHPDYPLLLPLSVARGWLYMGAVSETAPIIVALLFTLNIPALLWMGLTSIDKYAGLMGSAFVLGSTQLLKDGVSQYADIPLSAYYLGAVILVYMSQLQNRSLLFVAGLFAGFSFWTKNEGFPFAIALLVSTILWLLLKQDKRFSLHKMFPLLAGMAIVAAIVFHFKLTLAPPNDIMSEQSMFTAIEKLTDPDRYRLVWHHFTTNLPFFCGWRTIWPADAVAWYAGLSILLAAFVKLAWPPLLTIPTLTTLLLALAYVLIYVITPHDLEWHLKTSLNRLLLHLLPLVAFIYFTYIGNAFSTYRRKGAAHSFNVDPFGTPTGHGDAEL